MNKISAPNLHLFAYHLRNSLTSGKNTVPGAENLWKKWNQLFIKLGITKSINISGYSQENPKDEKTICYIPEEEASGNYVTLCKEDIRFEKVIELEGQKVRIDGKVSPIRIDDSYTLTFNIYRPEEENQQKTEPVPLSIFSEFNTTEEIFLPDFVNSSLGQTLILTADDITGDLEEAKSIAQKCRDSFIPSEKKRPLLVRQDLLFDSFLFEYGTINYTNTSNPYRHLIILLFPDKKSREKFESCYWVLQEIFFYRNKILTVYKTTIENWQKSYDNYVEIEKEVKKINDVLSNLAAESQFSDTILKNLKTKLTALPQLTLEHTINLRNLEHAKNTINIHQRNYIKIVEEIRLKISQESPADLSFLEHFSKQDIPFFVQKIQADINYFVHGRSLLDQSLASIRGIVEIEEAERDKSLQNQILALAAGIGVASTIAGSSGHLPIDKPVIFPVLNTPLRYFFLPKPIHPFVNSVVISVAAGLLTYKILLCFFTKKNKPNK